MSDKQVRQQHCILMRCSCQAIIAKLNSLLKNIFINFSVWIRVQAMYQKVHFKFKILSGTILQQWNSL